MPLQAYLKGVCETSCYGVEFGHSHVLIDFVERKESCGWGDGIPTEDVNIQRGLKQGDSLSPFLFLLVAEGFTRLMRNTMVLNLFRGFKVGRDEIEILHLQYADDTLCVEEATIENLWTLNHFLRGFEMASSLKVNFFKSLFDRC